MWRARTIPAVALAIVFAGCGSTVQEDSVVRVYVGPSDSELVEGAERALAEAEGKVGDLAVELVEAEPSASNWAQADVAAAARSATQDSTSIAYIGEQEPKANLYSVPVTNEAGLLQVSPARVERGFLAEPGGNDVPTDLQTTGERTFGTIGSLSDRNTPERVEIAGYNTMLEVLAAIDDAEDPLDRADVIAAFFDETTPIGELQAGAEL